MRKKSELPIDYVSNSKLEELKTQLTIDTSGFATRKSVEAVETKVTQLENRPVTSSYDDSEIKRKLKELEDRPVTANIDTSNFVTTTQLEDKHYLTEHQDISGLATKEQLKKAFLDDEEHEKYAKKTELPQPYNDTDIKSRLTTLENRPAGNVDTNDFATKDELKTEKLRIDTLEFNMGKTVDKFQAPFNTSDAMNPYEYFRNTRKTFIIIYQPTQVTQPN